MSSQVLKARKELFRDKLIEFKIYDYIEEARINDLLDFLDTVNSGANVFLAYLFDFDAFFSFRPDFQSLVAILLYPFFENSNISEEYILEEYGVDVLIILENLSKIHSLKYEENNEKMQLDSLRKIFLIMAKDIRVILISLAQRVYMMENIDSFYDEKTMCDISKETMDLYVPIASKLGVYRSKMKLEDFSFKYIFPREYTEIVEDLDKFFPDRDRYMLIAKRELKDFMDEHGIKCELSARIKSNYSIYKKLINLERGFSGVKDVHDVFAMRLIVETKDIKELYKILSLLNTRWMPLRDKFKDYVAFPKSNGYKSLHTVLFGLGGKNDRMFEVQIRTRDMHIEAEYGLASHWLYKSDGSKNLDMQSSWLKALKQIKPNVDSGDFSDPIKKVEFDFFSDKIFVLTPRGEVKDLPVNATPIDFAYSLHTEIGHKVYMAKVNDKVVPLDYELDNGDVVEVSTRVVASPKLEWLFFVKSSLAKARIKAWFNSQRNEEFLKKGKEIVNKYLESVLNKPLLDQKYSILKSVDGSFLSISQREQILKEIGKGDKLPVEVFRKVYKDDSFFKVKKAVKKKKQIVNERIHKVLVGGEDGLPLKMAKCCKPSFPEEIVAYVTRGNTLTIHKKSCKVLSMKNKERFIDASWD